MFDSNPNPEKWELYEQQYQEILEYYEEESHEQAA